MADSILRQSYNRRDVEHWRFHYDEYFHYGVDGRARKTTFLVSTETLSVWQNAMKWMEISAKMDMIFAVVTNGGVELVDLFLNQQLLDKLNENDPVTWEGLILYIEDDIANR